MRVFPIAMLAVMLSAGPSWAGPAVKASVVPMPPLCVSNFCGFSPTPCSTNTDCNRGSLSPKSKVSLGADGSAKIQLKGLTDANGTPLTTDGIVGTADDLLAWMDTSINGDMPNLVYKLEARNGTAKLSVNASAVLPPVGVLQLFGTILAPTPSCPGGNSDADVIARQSVDDCTTGVRIAWFGLQSDPESKTSVKGPVVDTPALCREDGNCAFVGGFCSTNADCDHGRIVGKSTASIRGDGTLKLKLNGVADLAGVPVTTDGVLGTADDYIAYVPVLSYSGSWFSDAQIKLDLNAGKVAGTYDISGVMPPAGAEVALTTVLLLTPPTNMANCPGGNSAEDIAARANDPDCRDGDFFAVQGVTQLP
jgi:hypothetical protein